MFRIEALIREIETLSEGRLTSTPLCGAENLTVRTFAPLNHAAADTVAFLAQSKYRDEAKASHCLLYTSPSPRDSTSSPMPSSA